MSTLLILIDSFLCYARTVVVPPLAVMTNSAFLASAADATLKRQAMKSYQKYHYESSIIFLEIRVQILPMQW